MPDSPPTLPPVIFIFVFSHKQTLRGNKFFFWPVLFSTTLSREADLSVTENGIEYTGEFGQEAFYIHWNVYRHLINYQKNI